MALMRVVKLDGIKGWELVQMKRTLGRIVFHGKTLVFVPFKCKLTASDLANIRGFILQCLSK